MFMPYVCNTSFVVVLMYYADKSDSTVNCSVDSFQGFVDLIIKK